MVSYSIYCISCSKSNKKYIGFTSRTLEIRLAEHKKGSIKKDRPLYIAMQKYGPESFTIELLYENTDLDYTLNTMEEFYIQKYKSEGIKLYNVQSGGRGYRNNPRSEPVELYDSNLILVKTYPSKSATARELGCDLSTVITACKNANQNKSSKLKNYWACLAGSKPVKKDTSYLIERNKSIKPYLGKKRPDHSKWMKINNKSTDLHKYHFVHKSGSTFYGTRIDLIEHFPDHNINSSQLGLMIRGKYKTHRGWKLLTDNISEN
jgi:hypothetical protein